MVWHEYLLTPQHSIAAACALQDNHRDDAGRLPRVPSQNIKVVPCENKVSRLDQVACRSELRVISAVRDVCVWFCVYTGRDHGWGD